ncbi:MAG: hypothetical protein WCW30_02200 [Candidatus Gracilibacteria bacterium]
MANTPDNTQIDTTLSPDIQTKMGVGESSIDTPEKAKSGLVAKEHETLDYVRNRDRNWWTRIGRMGAYAIPFVDAATPGEQGNYKTQIRNKASAEARDLFDKMDTLQMRTTARLRWYSLKSAKRFAEITARINVSTRVIGALRKEDEFNKADLPDFKGMAEGSRGQALIDRPISSRIPLLRGHIIRSKKTGSLGQNKLFKAATEVRTEESTKKREWEAKIQERFHKGRQAENSLRSFVLRHDPLQVTTIEDQLQKCAAEKPEAIKATVTKILENSSSMSKGQKDEQMKILDAAISTLSGRSGQSSKTFELAGRLTLEGTVSEILTQIRSRPLGTVLNIKIPHRGNVDMVLDANAPSPYLIFREKNDPKYRLTVDANRQLAWERKENAVATEAAKKATQAADAVKQAAENKFFSGTVTTDPGIKAQRETNLGLLAEAVKKAMLTAQADPTKVKKAVEDFFTRTAATWKSLLNGVAPVTTDIADLAHSKAGDLLPSTPYVTAPTESVAGPVLIPNFKDLEFALAA